MSRLSSAFSLAVAAIVLAACTLGPVPTRSARPVPTSTPTAAPTAVPTPSPSPTPSPIATNAVAQVVVDGLRLRNAPQQDATAVAFLRAGQRVIVTDGPRLADGLSWYEVSRGRSAVRGWIAASDADGTPFLQLVANGRIALRYRDAQRTGIGLVDADGANLVVLEGSPSRLEWSRDGKHVAFSMVNPLAQPGSAPEIFVMNADGGERHRIGRGADFTWSPDGSSVAIVEQGRIILHDPGDGRDIGRLPLPLTSVAELTWSPDRAHLALTAAGGDDGRDVYAVNADTGQLTRLTESGVNTSPAWSPDGSHLVFNSPSGVVMASADGSDVRPVSEGTIARPWSPDANFLLITRYGGLDLFDLRLQGSGTLARDDDASTVGPAAWSPDGSAIVYERVSRSDGGRQTIVLKPDGSEAHPLPGSSDLAVWQPILSLP
jgi:dipeptidyl aminopeptidase/acylaminoacyl peptidase